MTLLSFLDRLAGQFILLWGWKRALTALGAGALSALAMAPFHVFPVLFATFPVLVWLIDSTTADPVRGALPRFRLGFAIGWLFGFGYFLAGLWWIGNAFLVEADEFGWMLPFAIAIVPALLAVFWGVGCGLARLIWPESWARILSLAGFLSLAEYLRGVLFTGFPWNTIGYAAMPAPVAMQSASVFGLYGITLLAVPVFCVAALRPLPDNRTGRSAAILAIACGLATVAHLGYGAWKLAATPGQTVPDVRLRLVQPAIDQSEKWSTEMEDRNFRLLLDLSAGTAEARSLEEAGITHLVWPESAFPFVLTERSDALAALGRLVPDGAMLIAGALRVEAPRAADQRVFNSVYTIDDEGEITGAADKVHLVPFGEYLPLQAWAETIGLTRLVHAPAGFEAGTSRPLLDAGPAGRFLALICFEIIFPGSATTAGERPDFLVNLTNDAWFGMSPGPYQHLQQAIVRGVEEGLPVVRVANNGISSVTDGLGRSVAGLELGRRGSIDSPLPRPSPPTIYAATGNQLFFVMLTGFLFLAGITAARAGRSGH